MKKITLSVVLFVVLASIAGMFIGAFMSPLFMPDNPGLVAGAIVVSLSVIGLIVGLVAGLIIWRYLKAATLKNLNWLLGISCLSVILWLSYRYVNREKASGETPSAIRQVTKPATPVPSTIPPVSPDPVIEDKVSAGLGMGRPLMDPGQVIYFFQNPTDASPSDSLIFEEGPNHLVVSESSSAFAPEHMKLDYQICYFLVKSMTGNRLQVIVDKQAGQTAWVSKDQMDLLPWPMFLTTVHSVEPKNWDNNPVKMSPDDAAQAMENIGPNHILEAKSRSGDWLNVVITDGNYQQIGRGWIRWRKDGKLMLDYNLLS